MQLDLSLERCRSIADKLAEDTDRTNVRQNGDLLSKVDRCTEEYDDKAKLLFLEIQLLLVNELVSNSAMKLAAGCPR